MEFEQRVIVHFLYRDGAEAKRHRGARYPDPALGTVWGYCLHFAKCPALIFVCSTKAQVSEWWSLVWKAANWFSWYLDFVFIWKTTFSLGLLISRDSQCVANDNFELFARLASLEIFPFAVNFSPVDQAAPSHKSPEMQRVAAIAREYGGQ
jgi:hypothetical protein